MTNEIEIGVELLPLVNLNAPTATAMPLTAAPAPLPIQLGVFSAGSWGHHDTSDARRAGASFQEALFEKEA